ncbi:MAG: hypothetical protein M0004_16970 [Actinomycetota bacterium]|nr:hypothetical protein [Actinomycetota bacterium]
MSTAPLLRTTPRLDVHNASVDPAYAACGLCGMTHLQTGRVCVRTAHHAGSCEFQPRRDPTTLTIQLLSLVEVTIAPSHQHRRVRTHQKDGEHRRVEY